MTGKKFPIVLSVLFGFAGLIHTVVADERIDQTLDQMGAIPACRVVELPGFPHPQTGPVYAYCYCNDGKDCRPPTGSPWEGNRGHCPAEICARPVSQAQDTDSTSEQF